MAEGDAAGGGDAAAGGAEPEAAAFMTANEKRFAPLKAKLQIGCYGVAADGVEPPLGAVDAAEDPPDRLSAAHWERVVAEAERKSRPG